MSSAPSHSSDVSRALAEFVVCARWEDLAASVRHEAKRSLLNHFAAAFGGCKDPVVETMLATLAPMSGAATVGILGRSERLDALNAAFLNAVIANVFDFDDTHLRTVIHPAAPVAPALFSLAHLRKASGPELIHAFAIGVDVACRLGNAVSPWHYAHGWHITSTCGVVGAAAGCARLLGLDEDRTLAALGGAAVQACGLVEMLGTGAKSFSVGNAARNGLLAALAAERGLSGPGRPLEGPRGFAEVMGQQPAYGELTEGLGERWELSLNTYKPYPCGVVLHPVIDAFLQLRAEHGLMPGDLARIVVRGHPLLRQRTDRPNVTTGREAQVCIRHTAGVALKLGRAGITEYTDALVNDPSIRAIGALVEIEDDPAMTTESARVTIHAKDGRTLACHIPHARGSLGRPLSDAEIEGKAAELAAYNALSIDIPSLAHAVWTLDDCDDVKQVFALATADR